MENKFEEMTVDELREQLKRLQDSLCDLEDLHSFTFGKSSLHIGAERAQNMQNEFEEECETYKGQISEIEKLLEARHGERPS
jgi:hypothetical protein